MTVDYPTRILRWITDLLWPARCAACSVLGAVACAPCLARLRQPPHASRLHLTSLDRLIAATTLDEPCASFIYGLKYRGIRELAAPLADRLCDLANIRPETTNAFGANPLIVPVPLHASRLRERGYNQAELLAQRIATNAAMSLMPDALVRTRATSQQAKTADRAQRYENIKGAFTCVDHVRVAGRDIVLVDDVSTTGATLDDCARALKESGARRVTALVVAHG